MRAITLQVSILLLFTFLEVQAQSGPNSIELLGEDQLWFEGNVVLASGTAIKGLVKFNDREGFVAFNDGDNKKVFTANGILKFDFLDEQLKKRRQFLVLPFTDPKTGGERDQIFEVIREYDEFAILLKKNPVATHRRAASFGYDYSNGTGGSYTKTEVSQEESILFLDSEGKITPYIKVTHREDGVKSILNAKDRKSKSKVVDEDLLAQFVTDPIYEKLKEYAAENDLKFKIMEDFLKLLDHYDTIRK